MALETLRESGSSRMDEASVVNYNMRPSYLDNGIEDPLPLGSFDCGVKRRLSEEFLDPNDPATGGDKIKTFLRIRPESSRNAIDPSTQKVFEVEDDSTLVVHAPLKRLSTTDLSVSRFTFSHVFDQGSSQTEIFDECVLNLVNGLFTGGSGLIFSYGATNSGKTYTMQGYGREFGIVPRTLEHIFTRLEHSLYKRGDIKPNQFDSYLILDEINRKLVAEAKSKILRESKVKPADVSLFVDSMIKSSSSMCTSAVNQEDHALMGLNPVLIPDETLLSDNTLPSAPLLYSIWVSFAEIYNERVFDLFETVQKGKRRKDLKLYQDSKGRVYINDLTECCANSAEEAYQLFLAGKHNLQFASTQMNSNSSRSHSFFNIRMVVIGRCGPHVYPKEVFRFSFCDLAGIERVSQTGNVGHRLKESGSINQSLIVLLRCIRALRDKQEGKKASLDVIPFRDSKLARIFKSFLTTATQVSMIVNVNPDPEMIESSLFVLQNSALASSVRTHKKVEAPVNNSLFCRKLRASMGIALREPKAEAIVLSEEEEAETEDEDSPEKPSTVKRRPTGNPSALQIQIGILTKENMNLQRQVRRIEEETREQLNTQYELLLNEQRESYSSLIDKEAEYMKVLSQRRLAMAVRELEKKHRQEIQNIAADDDRVPNGKSTATQTPDNVSTGTSVETQTPEPPAMNSTASNTEPDLLIQDLKRQQLRDAEELCFDYHKKLTEANDVNEKLTRDVNALYKERSVLLEDQECLHASLDSTMERNKELEQELKVLKLKQRPEPPPRERRNLLTGDAFNFLSPALPPPRRGARRSTFAPVAKPKLPSVGVETSGLKRKLVTSSRKTEEEKESPVVAPTPDLTESLSSEKSEGGLEADVEEDDDVFNTSSKRKRITNPESEL